jgi:hypothetical protein
MQMKARVTRNAVIGAALLLANSAPGWALGGGRLAATQAINGLAGEFSGPLAYGVSLAMIVGSAVAWFRHHHDMGALGQGALGATFVSGVALGSASLLSFIPGATGALV